jgi:hypothetical protein
MPLSLCGSLPQVRARLQLPTLVLITLLVAPVSNGHTGGKVEMKCPLDGTTFEAWQDFSGTTFARRLDLKSLGPTSSPWSLGQCPKCRLPLYADEFTEQQISDLRRIVKSREFKRADQTGSAYAALAIILENTGAEPFSVGYCHLQASWQLEAKVAYAASANAAIRWFDVAAKTLARTRDADDMDRRLTSLYTPIELLRRTGRFDKAAARLAAFPHDGVPGGSWLADALDRQQTLISARDHGNDEAFVWEQEEKRHPPLPPLKHAVIAATPAETALLADARTIAEYCNVYALTEGVDTVKLTIDPATGRLGPATPGISVKISSRTQLVDDTWEMEGTFSLRHPDAFGGNELVFDRLGFSMKIISNPSER